MASSALLLALETGREGGLLGLSFQEDGVPRNVGPAPAGPAGVGAGQLALGREQREAFPALPPLPAASSQHAFTGRANCTARISD